MRLQALSVKQFSRYIKLLPIGLTGQVNYKQ
jgi:hypothetical protein